MRFNILIGGKAGQGINELANILARAFCKEGFHVFNYRDYPSLITGGHNFNILCLSDKKVGSFDEKYDVLLALDEKTFEINKKKLRKNSVVIANCDVPQGINLTARKDKTENMAFAAALFKIMGLQKKNLVDFVKERFAGKSLLPKDLEVIEEFYEKNYEKCAKISTEILKQNNKKKFILNGSEGIAQGAENSGLDVYFCYPMTPSTPALNFLAKKQDEKFFAFTPENELAVVNAALGASFAGNKVMVGTSGGGFSLMAEAMTMQGCSELPLTVYLSQRQGPSTGQATYTGQQDLLMSIFAGYEDCPRVVVAPANAKEAVEKTNELIYLAEKYGVLSILLGDKHLAESDFTYDKFDIKSLKVPLRKQFAGRGIFKRTSYEHDENWNNCEDAEKAEKSVVARYKKGLLLRNEIEKFERYKVYGKGKNLIVSFGSTKGLILDSIEGLDVKFLQLLYLEPFPKDILKFIKQAKNVFIIEHNITSQLSKLIAMNIGYTIKDNNKILKYNGRVFTPEELIKELKKRGIK